MSKVILLAGNIGAGKDTVAGFFNVYGEYAHFKFANRLKDFAAVLLNIYREDLSHRNHELFTDPVLKNTAKVWNNLTPRELLQRIGTNAMRRGLSDSVWVDELKKEMQEYSAKNNIFKFVISDCRFPNEYSLFVKDRNYNTILVYIEREEIDAQIRPSVLTHIQHPSEYYQRYLRGKADVVLTNNGTLEELEYKVKDLVAKIG